MASRSKIQPLFYFVFSVAAGLVLHLNSFAWFEEDPKEEQAQRDLVRKTFNPTTRVARGGWVGGGGGGVFCFQSDELAESAFDSNGYLKPEMRDLKNFTTGGTLDLFEGLGNGHQFVDVIPGEDATQYLNRVVTGSVAKLAPRFAKRLLWALDQVSVRKWNHQSSIPQLKDVGELPEYLTKYFTNCRYVQFVIRYEQKKRGHIARVFIDYDEDLFKMLESFDRGKGTTGIRNQAMIILHEAVYLLASEERGEANSLRSRQLTAFLLSQKILTELSKIPSLSERQRIYKMYLEFSYGIENPI